MLGPILAGASILGGAMSIKPAADLIDQLFDTDLLGRKEDAKKLARYEGNQAESQMRRLAMEEIIQEDLGRRIDRLKPSHIVEDPFTALDYEMGVRDTVKQNEGRLGAMAQVLDDEPSLQELVLKMGYGT